MQHLETTKGIATVNILGCFTSKWKYQAKILIFVIRSDLHTSSFIHTSANVFRKKFVSAIQYMDTHILYAHIVLYMFMLTWAQMKQDIKLENTFY